MIIKRCLGCKEYKRIDNGDFCTECDEEISKSFQDMLGISFEDDDDWELDNIGSNMTLFLPVDRVEARNPEIGDILIPSDVNSDDFSDDIKSYITGSREGCSNIN